MLRDSVVFRQHVAPGAKTGSGRSTPLPCGGDDRSDPSALPSLSLPPLPPLPLTTLNHSQQTSSRLILSSPASENQALQIRPFCAVLKRSKPISANLGQISSSSIQLALCPDVQRPEIAAALAVSLKFS